MKKIYIQIAVIFAVLIVLSTAMKITNYYSTESKNTRAIEQKLSQGISAEKGQATGNVKDLIPFDYDRMFVFKPYEPIEQMEKQIGFKYPKLQQGVSEGMLNILFVKDNSAAAYLFGYGSNTGYYISLPPGEYTKAQIDKMTYTVKKNEVGNSAGTPKTYMYYQFK